MTDTQGHKEQQETLRTLKSRMSKFNEELAKARKPIGAHEDRFKSKRLLADATEKVATLEAEVKTATAGAAPLLEQGGEPFLVQASIGVLAKALSEYAKEKELDEEKLFNGVNEGKKITAEKFGKYIEGLGATIGHEEINFTAARCLAIAKVLGGGRSITKEGFLNIFKRTGSVNKEVAITDGFSVTDSKVVCKAASGDAVELFGMPKEDASKMLRYQ